MAPIGPATSAAQATLALELPECDQVCRKQARAELLADSAVK